MTWLTPSGLRFPTMLRKMWAPHEVQAWLDENAPMTRLNELREMEARKDAAYLERNQVVAALAKAFPSGVARTAIEGWSEDWHGCVYIDLPTGQASWHFHDSQAYLFEGLPAYTKPWDGHSTEEKYARLAALYQPAVGAQPLPAQTIDPTDPGFDVSVLREHVKHLERRVRQLSTPPAPSEPAQPVPAGDVIGVNESIEYEAVQDGCVQCSDQDLSAVKAWAQANGPWAISIYKVRRTCLVSNGKPLATHPQPAQAGEPVGYFYYDALADEWHHVADTPEGGKRMKGVPLYRGHAVKPAGAQAGGAVYQFEIWQGDDLQASGESSDVESMRSEAAHYAAQYSMDGFIKVLEFVRYPLTTMAAIPEAKEPK